MSDRAVSTPNGGQHAGGRCSVVPGIQGRNSSDVYLAVARLSPMPMCLSDPNQPDDPLMFVNRKRCGVAILPGCVLSVVGLLEAGSFELTLCLTLTTTRGLGIAG